MGSVTFWTSIFSRVRSALAECPGSMPRGAAARHREMSLMRQLEVLGTDRQGGKVRPVAARNRGVVGVDDPMAPTVTMVLQAVARSGKASDE